MHAIDLFYDAQPEPLKSCLLALRSMILSKNKQITTDWKYNMPFFNYKGKRICYLWVDNQTQQPYIGFVDGNRIIDAHLIQGNRSRMKIMRFDPSKDLPVKSIGNVLQKAIDLQDAARI